ncbi:MAG TPA: DUF3291 domain-containing protein [Terriglobales bacterium]|nr:DUF3291 domain-containing protein [Terriglobales bacterium]
MAVVSITRLRVRSWRFLPWFFLYALRSARQAAKADGNLAARLLRDQRNTFWTGTIWTSDAAMKHFMLSGVHRGAMPKLLNWCDEAALVHWTQEGNELPSWAEACARLEREGRPSKIYHPSPAHAAHKFPEPRVTRGSEFRLK